MNISDLKEKEEWLKYTLTVGELIYILNKYPQDMKVMITWESTVHDLKPSNIYEAHTGTLYLDADGDFYKKDYAKDPNENEQ
jgi:ribosomal protein L21E